MGNSGYVSLSHATALERSLNMTAHNLANASTAGFKAMFPVFEAKSHGPEGALTAINYVQDNGTFLDNSQGPMTRTDNPTDFAVTGDGWFGFEAGGGTVYGRFGQLTLDVDGQLVTAAGHAILDRAQPFRSQPTARLLTISARSLGKSACSKSPTHRH